MRAGRGDGLVGDWWPIRRLLDRAAAASASSARRLRCPMKLRCSMLFAVPPTRQPANARWHSVASSCCFSTAPCSICSKRGRCSALSATDSGREGQLPLGYLDLVQLTGCLNG